MFTPIREFYLKYTMFEGFFEVQKFQEGSVAKTKKTACIQKKRAVATAPPSIDTRLSQELR
jgi:hypothetical protein